MSQKDVFPDIFELSSIEGFRAYLQELILKHQNSLTYTEAISKLVKYLKWLDTPVRSPFRQEDWLGSESARLLISSEAPLSFVVFDPTIAFPQLSREWGYVLWDSLFPLKAEGFSLIQAEDLVTRDNFGILTDRHFYPLPSSSAPLAGLGRALLDLASNIRRHWVQSVTPISLITLFRTVPNTNIPAPIPRAYHTLPSGEYITVVKETLLLDLCDEDTPTSCFIKSPSVLSVNISATSSPVSSTPITEQVPSKSIITLKKGKKPKRPKKPKLLSKAEFRLPWNNLRSVDL